MKFDLKEFEEKMKKTISVFESDLVNVRAGRANAGILDKVKVDYYGVPTAINQMAEIKTPDPRTLTIQPWDSTTLKAIEKAIIASDIGIFPANDGKMLRMAFPQPTEERRKELTKQVSKMGEDAKVAVRNVRRDANDKIKDQKKAGILTEDDVKVAEKDVQALTDKYIKNVEAVVAKKDAEIMAI
ncbi:MAG: ribosome recycling factor [Ruminococcaceae bacterium]|nr:ribosome recycling factor [Oscillospiraceae bacterium]